MTQGNAAVHAEESKLFPMRLLGFGLYLAWNALVSSFEQTSDIAGLSSPLFRLYLGTLLSAGALIAVAVYVHLTDRYLWSRRVVATCGTAAVLYGLLEIGATATGLLVLDLFAIICKSMADVGLFLMWSACLANRGPRIAWISYAGSMATATCIYFIASAQNRAVLTIAVLSLPIISCALLAISGPHPSSNEATPPEASSWSVPWRPILLVAIFSFARHLVGHYGGNVLVADELGRLIAAAIVLVPLLLAFDRFDLDLVARLCPALVVAALALSGIHGLEDGFGFGKLLACTGYFAFLLYLFLALNTLCYRYGVRAEWLFGIVQSTNILAALPGASLGNHLQALETTSSYIPIDVSMGITSVMVVLLCMGLITSNATEGTWGMRGIRRDTGQPAKGGDSDEKPMTRDYLRDHIQRCSQVARHFGLTHREEEVLALLSEGKTFQEAEAVLCIAHGTMRVHVQHIYNKLNVHSGEEACAVVKNWGSS